MSCRASPSPPNTRVPSKQGYGPWWARSLWLPLSCSGDTAESQWHPTAAAAFWTCWIPLPRWSPAFCYMEWPHLPVSPWLQCSTCLPTDCTGAPGCCNPLVPKGLPAAQALGKESSLEGAEGKARPRGPQQHPSIQAHWPWLLEDWRNQGDETPRPDDAVSPREQPRGMQPLQGPSATDPTLPSLTHGSAGEFSSSSRLVTPLPILTSHPQAHGPPSCPRCSSTHAQTKPWLSVPGSKSSSSSCWAAPRALQPLPEQEPCPGPAPSCAPTQPPGGLQARRENKTLSSTLRFTQLTQKRSPAAPHKSTGCPS